MNHQPAPETTCPYLVLGQADHCGRLIVDSARALHDLIVTFGPLGHYSVRAIEDECGPAVHCAFEHKGDADRLAESVGAIEIVRYQRYRSERVFCLSDVATQQIRLVVARRWPSRFPQVYPG